MQSSKASSSPVNTLLAPFLLQFQKGLLGQVSSSIPLLTTLTQYYVNQPSKRMRPCLILLMCQATNGLGSEWHVKLLEAQASTIDSSEPLSENVLPSQICLAQIIEMLHVASLLHDDVIDEADTRRGAPSVPAVFGNHRTILGGDYLLGRAMALAASLGCTEVTSLVANAVCTLVEGELVQLGDIRSLDAQGRALDTTSVLRHVVAVPQDDPELSGWWEEYLQKTYMKTASLFAHALQCGVLLGGVGTHERWKAIAGSYGERLGMAFQLIDDLLDFEGDAQKLGKPANADLSLGIATAPVFFAVQEDASLRPLVLRRFNKPGDIEKMAQGVRRTQALTRTRELAEYYARWAQEALGMLPDSMARRALHELTAAVLTRQS
ncbi:terpenoid synthase [Trametes maxima]|nr:terpenoid synthase [Trametes maxima]